MSATAVPDDIRRLILTAIPSVPYLEAVLQFQREPDLPRSAADIAGALYVSTAAAAELLKAMCEAGVLQALDDDQFVYAPEAALRAALERLAEVYGRHLIEVTELIHDTTQRSAQRFAEAFQLRRRK